MSGSSWRITASNPIRDLGRLDYERCAALHNEIIERGWLGSSSEHTLDNLNRTTYFERWHNEPSWQEQAADLHPSLVEFLKLAIDPRYPGSFFYTVYGIIGPRLFFNTCNYGMFDDMHRFVLLYMTSQALDPSHGVGIVFDQHTFLAIFQEDMMASETTMMGGKVGWQALEEILDSFIDMIDQGKVLALPTDPMLISRTGHYKSFQAPWTMPPFTEVDLEGALSQFERLVEAIESRMPPGSLPDGPVGYGCLDDDREEVRESLEMIQGQDFARSFLAAVRRPRFTYIAPGLTCVGVGPQPFASLAPVDDFVAAIRPVLLARGDADAADDVQFRTAFQEPPAIPCGLYLTELNTHRAVPFEDSCRLALPYKLGQNRHGRRSDLTLFGEGSTLRMRGALTSNDIYQQGYNPFIRSHDTQLKRVLEWWCLMVEQGHWDVDENGVAGGIEKWRDADSEEHWMKYLLPIHW